MKKLMLVLLTFVAVADLSAQKQKANPNKQAVIQLVDKHQAALIGLSDNICEFVFSEVCYTVS
jgi:hypothetical protein